MPEQEKARHGGRAKGSSTCDDTPRGGPRQGPRLPRPDELKARIEPAAFFARELDGAPELKAKRDGWSQNIACPFHTDPNPSFGVNLRSGAFRCFGCEAQGGSVLDFLMLRDGLDLNGARAALADRYGIAAGEAPRTRAPSRARRPAPEPEPQREPLAPIPAEALASRPQAHPQHGRPSATWTYRDAEGRALAFVCRFDPVEGRKQFAPLTWTLGGGWTWKAPRPPRPPYGLDRLAARGEAPALICEGEKASDAAGELVPEAATVATFGGAQAPGKSDLSPLSGRRVLIWPDADPPGASYAATVAELAHLHGAVSVEILDLSTLARDPATGEPRTLAKGWDAADALADGWTSEALAAAARWRPVPRPDESTGPDPEEASEDAAPPHPFELKPGGIYYRKPPNAKGGGDDSPPLWIAPPLKVLAVTRDERGGDFGRLVAFRDLDGTERREVIADRERQGSGDALRSRLAGLGFETATHPEARRLFLELLRRWTPEKRSRSVSRTGWTEDLAAYIRPDVVIGEGPEPVVLAVEGELPAFAPRGTLEDWRATVAALCVGNSRLEFAVSLAFAPPLLALIGAEGGGFHLRGSSVDASSSGKTTTQRIAASVWGSPSYVQAWRATDNALEGLAELHSDALLVLDELNQMDPKAAGEAAYLLANGSGKARSDRNAAARAVKKWRVLFLSSGEIGLAEHMATVQRKARAGQEVRMIEVPADAGAGLGCFEHLHGFKDGAAFALALADAAAASYGTPALAFLRALVAQRAEVPAVVKRARDGFAAEVLSGTEKPSGQVRRVAARFGLVAAAGELASLGGITGWAPGAAKAAAARCFRDWLKARGGAMSAEERDLVRQVRFFFEQHANRFRWRNRADDDHAPEIPKACGFKDVDASNPAALVFYAFTESFRAEIVEGHDPIEAARILQRVGLLLPGDKGHTTRRVRFPTFGGPIRVYAFVRPTEPEGGDDGS